jgi:hypothetical protein
MKEKFEAICSSLEKIPTNVHAITMIVIGGVLVLCKHEEAGKGLMMSGAAIFSHKA